jgi:hypothetical protein
MGSHCSFGYLKHKLWPKEGLGVKLRVELSTTKKLGINSIYVVVRGVRHTVEKLSTRTLLHTTLQFKVCSQSYGAPKLRESHLVRFLDCHSGVPRKKSHLDVGFVANHRVYYKEEGGGLPQIQAVVNLVCSCCLWLVLAPRVLQICTNHFVWVMCRLV